MDSFPGLGTAINVVAIVVGSALGILVGHRLPERNRHLVTDALGLITLLVGALSAAAITSDALRGSVGVGVPLLVVLGSLLLGGIVGSLLRIEDRLEHLGLWLRRRLVRGSEAQLDESVTDPALDGRPAGAAERFIEGFVSASLLFCVGPLAILGAVSDGMGRGIDQLALKSVIDGFAAVAFASTLGVGVMLSALSVLVYQGVLTLLGVEVGGVLSPAEVDILTVTGGVLLIGIGLRLLRIRQIPVADMLPALLLAPLAVGLLTRV